MDISLHYQAYGQGRPLVLLHGNGGDSGYFSQLIPAFARHHRVIAVDTRGHGHSPRGQAPFSIRQFAQDLKAFLDQHGLTQVDLLGFSDGGNIALTFALQYPASLRRLVLNGANLNPAGLEPWFRLPVALGYRGAALLAGKSAWAREKEELFGLMVHEPTIRPRDRRAYRRMVRASWSGESSCWSPGLFFIEAAPFSRLRGQYRRCGMPCRHPFSARHLWHGTGGLSS